MTEDELRIKITKSPTDPKLHHDLGCLCYQKGDLGGALGAFLTALILAPDNITFLQNALHVLGTTSGYTLPNSLLDILAQWVDHEDVNIQDMSMVIHNHYGSSALMGTLLNVLKASEDDIETILASDHFDPFFNDPLLGAVMQKAIIITPLLELIFTGLRRHILRMATSRGLANHAMSRRLEFLAALACQCFNTEYAYEVTDEEQNDLTQLIENNDPTFDETGLDDTGLLIKFSIIGTYQPLHTVIDTLPSFENALSPALAALFERQFHHHHDEMRRLSYIIPLTKITGDISKKVQQQYEQYPYPRWIRYSKGKKSSFSQFIRERFPDQKNNITGGKAIDLLIPGCGTGMQVCKLASSIAPANIVALDISRTSLAYAMRAIEHYGFKNIKYFHADIMELGDIAEQDDCALAFDYIDCTGVLHHLAEPSKGLSNLNRLLRPGGYMRLALYSERGRKDVIAARDYVKEQGFEDSVQGVRDFRMAVRALPQDHPIASVAQNQDFYSISGLHDLIFNVNENRYTPKELKEILDQEGLQFLSFDHINSAVSNHYGVQYPQDKAQRNLYNWDDFEQKNPDTFGFMYHFWCRKAFH